jgi:hypothetical protein
MAIITLNNNSLSSVTALPSAIDTGSLILLNEASGASSIAQLDIDSTYINSTYNNYKLYLNLSPVSDGVYLYARFFVNGSVRTGSSDYTYVDHRLDSSTYSRGMSDGVTQMTVTSESGTGHELYEKISCVIDLTDVTSTNQRATIRSWNISKNPSYLERTSISSGTLKDTTHPAVNGIRFYWSSGNIDYYDYKLYGVKS